jgi:hypothetical protein
MLFDYPVTLPSCFRCGAGALMAAIALSSPALAAERELDEDTAPATAKEIKTPIQRVFPEVEVRPPLLPFVKEWLQDLPPFFADTQLEIHSRTFYKRNDKTDDTTAEAWAAGGSIAYHSGWLADTFAIELEGFTSQKLIGEKSKDGTLLLDTGQDSYTVLGIANGKLRYKGISVTCCRHYLDLPYMNRQDSRMTPNTFEGVTVAKNEGDLRFSTGYAWKIKLRNSNEFDSFTESRGFDKDKGLIHGGVVWDPNENFHFGAIAATVPDLLGGLYHELGVGHQVSEDVYLRFDGQFTFQWDPGDDLSGSQIDDSWNLGFRGSASYKGAVFRLGAAFTGTGGSIVSLYGTNPSYVDLMQNTFTRENESAILASLSYDFARLGAPGLSAIMNFVAAFDGKPNTASRSQDAQELNLTIDYKLKGGWLDSFWLRFKGSWLHEQRTEQNGTDLRVILRYDFPVI